MKTEKRVADLMAEALVAAGVERVWGVVGDSLNGFTDALSTHDSIRWLHVRHEEVAGFAAGAGASLLAAGDTCAGWGYLAALRDVTVHADAHLGQCLNVSVRVSARLGEIAVIDGEVHAEGQLLAAGQFKIFMPEVTA